MAEQATEPTGSGNKWLGLIVGVVLVLLGSTVFKDLQVPIPGLDLNLGKSAAMAGITILLFPLIRTFYTDPLKNAINERNSQLEETFTEAEELRQRMDEMRGEYEQRLSAAEAARGSKFKLRFGKPKRFATNCAPRPSNRPSSLRRRRSPTSSRKSNAS